jgi:hypothetical protein
MIDRYVTSAGVELRIDRIPRQRIDRFSAGHPIPEPPTIAVETWAGDTEDVPNPKDPDYQQELLQYWLEVGKQHVALIADAVTLADDVDLSELDELREIGVGGSGNTVADFLRYTISDYDVQSVVEIVLYKSTVTTRGLMEASARYNVRWHKRKLDAFVILGKSRGAYGPEFEARRAAQFAHIKWAEFCELPGWEQSDIVAFLRLNSSLGYLQVKEAG